MEVKITQCLWSDVCSSYMVSLWCDVYSCYMVSLWCDVCSSYMVSLWCDVCSNSMVSSNTEYTWCTPRNRLPSIMTHYSQTGRRNHGRSLKRLLDTWDRKVSTSGPTPWEKHYYYYYYRLCGAFLGAPASINYICRLLQRKFLHTTPYRL